MRALRLGALLLALGTVAVVQAQPRPHAAPGAGGGGAGVRGVVTSVVDGDSLWITPDGGGKPMQLRLAGIDAPEICQEHGPESKAFLAELVLKKPVRVVTSGHDTYGRTLAHVHLEGVEVNRRLVEEGQAWSLRTKWDQGPYVSQEKMARALSRGLHRAGTSAIAPKDFRTRHGPCPGHDAPADPKR
ncbi:MAG: thermonuclease family protein [Rubrivivax sp.]